MEHKYKLTIALITMNRAEQLREAVLSCAASVLPEKTQFVIVDNASTDNTEAVVSELKTELKYDLVYRKEAENRGVGGGRNICFELSEGEYIYFFDDDAVIPEAQYGDFFTKSLDFMDKNTAVALLTTDIDDKVFGRREMAAAKTLTVGGLRCVFTFHGGSTFARRECFSSPMFMNIMYGNEEIAVAMSVLDRGLRTVYMPHIYMEHRPIVNKWNGGDKDRLNMQGISNIYAIKKLIYPAVFEPMLYMAYKKRIKNNGITDKALIAEFDGKRKEFMKKHKMKKVSVGTVLTAYKEFGLRVF